MPKNKGASRKTRWGIPKRVVEGFAKRDLRHLGWIHESGFYKKPRGNLRYGTEFRSRTSLMAKPAKKGERLFLHTHPERAATANCALPSFNDLRGLLTMYKEYGINTWVISRVNEKGEEIGRTFLKLRIKDEKKVNQLIGYMERLERSLKDMDIEEREKRLEIEAHKLFRKWRSDKLLSVKFIPMQGYRFDERIDDFVSVREGSVKSRR